MYIDDGKVVGAYVSDMETSGRNYIFTILDGDNTPTREFTTYKYIQTPQLALMGISVSPKGVITVNMETYNKYQYATNITDSDIPIVLEFNNKIYACPFDDIVTVGHNLTFNPIEDTSFPIIYNDVVIPSVTQDDEDKVLTVVDEEGTVRWADLPKPRFYYNTKYVNTNVYVIVDDLGVEVKQSEVDWTKGVIIGNEYYTPIEKDSTSVRYITGTDKAFKVRVFTAAPTTEYSTCSAPATYYYMPTTGSSNAGKILKVNNQYRPEWADMSSELSALGCGRIIGTAVLAAINNISCPSGLTHISVSSLNLVCQKFDSSAYTPTGDEIFLPEGVRVITSDDKHLIVFPTIKNSSLYFIDVYNFTSSSETLTQATNVGSFYIYKKY